MRKGIEHGIVWLFVMILAFSLAGCGGSSTTTAFSTVSSSGVAVQDVKAMIEEGKTAPNATDRVLLVDVRSSSAYIGGHISQSLTAPLDLFTDNGKALYTNGYDRLDVTASTAIRDSWLSHFLVNQLVNDFSETYQDSKIIFYGASTADARTAMMVARQIGFTQAYYMTGGYAAWLDAYPGDSEMNYAGIESIDIVNGSFIMTGYINDTNYANVSAKGTHHCITFNGGALHNNALFQVHLPPFCFQEMLTYLGASPLGNMADGIYFGTMDEWRSKFTDGEPITYSITWDGAGRYYEIDELFEEKPSQYQPDPDSFVPVGFEARIGGTRESNLNWNPGCILCFYSCVCGITSNSHANEDTWFADGGVYNDDYADMRNYYAGRYYPRTDILPGMAQPIRIKVQINRFLPS
jgi:rhodanese-related sulfurtransferase